MAFNLAPKKTDFLLIFLARILRMFSYGMLAIVMIKNLQLKNFTGQQIGIIQFAVILGDIVVSLILTTKADLFGRKKTLMLGALLKLFTGFFYAYSSNIYVLVITGIIGVISVTGTEIGPFLPIEQSTITQIIQDCSDRKDNISADTSRIFGYYGMVGYLSEACGGIFAGFFYQYLVREKSWSALDSTNFFFYVYALFGLVMFLCYSCIDNSRGIEAKEAKSKALLNFAGIQHKNFPTIVMLSVLFAFDALGGAFVAKSFISYYFYQRYDIVLTSVGALLFFCNIVSGISGILSSKLVEKFGAMATMIFTHLPSNIFLLLIPLASDPYIAMILLLGRFCISQMDVPARQTYVTMIVSSHQRSAANGITNIARSVGLSIGMGLNGLFISEDPLSFQFTIPFLLAGGIKIVYDITLGCCFLWNKKSQQKQKHFQLGQLQSQKTQSQYQVQDQIKVEQKSEQK